MNEETSHGTGIPGRALRIVLYEPSGRGGVCHYTFELAEHLSRAGADVTLMTTEDYELAELPRRFRVDHAFGRSWLTRLRRGGRRSPSTDRGDGGAERARTPHRRGVLWRLRLRWLHLRAVARLFARRTDVVHFQWLVDRGEGLRFMRWLRRAGIPSIYTAHDVEPHLTASTENRRELAQVYEAAAKVVVHTESNKSELLAVFEVDPAKVAVIPHGSYDFLCALDTVSREAARERFALPRSEPVVLFFGLIKRYKGLEYLVKAFEIVRNTGRDAFLLVVGDIFAGDPDGYRDYRRLIDGLASRGDVRCVARYVPVEDIGAYFAASDVVVLPYVRTYHSGVLLAAYAAGRPVIVTDTGGLAEVVEPGRTGLVVPPADSAALAAALGELLADPSRLKSMGERARALATTVYGWSAIAARTLELYATVTNPPPRAV